MSYLTIGVEIDHGRIVPTEPEKLPEEGKGILTIIESRQKTVSVNTMTRFEAFRALQKNLNLDQSRAAAWMDLVREAGR